MPLHERLEREGFWYDDIILLPNNVIDFERRDVDLSSRFTKRIVLKTPFVSSPMDTVTGADMAIAMALLGGIGVIHYNFGTIEEQVEEVKKVKRFEAAFVKDPVCLGIDAVVGDVYDLNRKHSFFTAPIVEEGRLVGLVKHSDVRYIEDMNVPVRKIMTPKESLITANRRDTLDKPDLEEGIRAANRIIRKNNLETLPIVDDDCNIVALVTDRDLRTDAQYPLATKGENKQLRVFAAVESRLELAKSRILALYEAGCDGIVIDAGSVFYEQIDLARYCKENTDMEVIPGSIATAALLEKVVTTGPELFDAYRIGVGPGMSCITQEILGMGNTQGRAVYDCSKKAKELGERYGFRIPTIGDGGIKNAGDIAKALASGADTVMMGGLLAGLEESPGEAEWSEEDGYLIKKFRGMGSVEAMEHRSADRYGYKQSEEVIKVPEGKTMNVPYKGHAYKFIPQWLISPLKQSLLKLGFRNIPDLQKNVEIVPWLFKPDKDELVEELRKRGITVVYQSIDKK